MSNGIDRSQILSQLKVILTPQEYTACEGLNDAELSAKLREALSNNSNMGVGDVADLGRTIAEISSSDEIIDADDDIKPKEDSIEDTLDDNGGISGRTIRSSNGRLVTVVEYSNGFPSKKTVSDNGVLIEESKYEVTTQSDGTKFFVITTTKPQENKTIITKALGIDMNGNYSDETFISQSIQDGNNTATTEIMTGEMLLNFVRMNPGLNFDTSKISSGSRYLCEKIANSDGSVITLNVYNSGSITQLNSGNAFKFLQSKTDGNQTKIVKYDGNGNTITTTNAGDGWERLAKRFFNESIKNNPGELAKKKAEIAALNRNKRALQAGEEILIPGEFDADSSPLLHTQSPERARQIAEVAEQNRAVERVNYSSVTGETTLTKDYSSVEAYAREMLVNEGITNPTRQQINDRKNEIIVLNNGKISYKKGDIIKTVVSQVSPQITQKLVQYGFAQNESNFIFYQRFNQLTISQQQNVLGVLQYCKVNNITDSTKIKAKILETFPDINLFDSGKTIPSNEDGHFTDYAQVGQAPVAIETFITDKLKLNIKSGNGKLLYERLCQLPQSELNKIPYSRLQGTDFSNMSFSQILNMFSQYVQLRTSEETKIQRQQQQKDPIFQRRQTVEMIRKMIQSCRGTLQAHLNNLKDNMFTNLGEIMVEDLRFYGGTEVISKIAEKLGFKSGKLDALTKSIYSKIDELQTMETKLATIDVSSSNFDKAYKDIMGVDYNAGKVQQLMDLRQQASVSSAILGNAANNQVMNQKLEQLLIDIMGNDFKTNVTDYLSWSQGAGSVAEIALMTYATMGIGSVVSETVGTVTTAVGRFGVGALTLGSYSGMRFGLNFLDDIDNIISGEKTIGGVLVGERNAETIKQGAQIIRNFVTGAISEDEANNQLEKLHLSFDDFMSSRGGQWVVNTTTSAIVGGVAGAASPIFQRAGQIGTHAGQKFAEKFPTIGNMLGLNAPTLQEVTAKIITSNPTGINGVDFMAKTYAALNGTNVAGKGLQFLTETMLFYATDLPMSIIQELLSESNTQLENALKNGTLGEYLVDKLKDQAVNLLKVKSIGMIVGMMVSAGTVAQQNSFEEYETLKNSTVRYEDVTTTNSDGTQSTSKVVTVEGPNGKIFIQGDLAYYYSKQGQLITSEHVSSETNFENLDAGSKTVFLLSKMMQFENYMKSVSGTVPVTETIPSQIQIGTTEPVGNQLPQAYKVEPANTGLETPVGIPSAVAEAQTLGATSIYGKLSNNIKLLLKNPINTLNTFSTLALNPDYSAKVVQLITDIRDLGHEINKTSGDILETSDLTALTEVLLNSLDVVDPKVERIVTELNELAEIIEDPEIITKQENEVTSEPFVVTQSDMGLYLPQKYQFSFNGLLHETNPSLPGAAHLLEAPALTPPSPPKSLTGRIKHWIKGTPIGRRISTGIQNAKGAVSQTLIIPQENNEVFYENYKNMFKQPRETFDIVESLIKTPEYQQLCEEFAKHYEETGRDPEIFLNNLKNSSDIVKIYQMMIEQSGVGPTKLAQIISNMTSLMDQIGEKSPELRTAIENTRSNCIPTRTLEDAQADVDKAFPVSGKEFASGVQHNFTIIDRMGTASMGETYIAERSDGSRCIIKLLKKGVDATQLDLEKRFYTMLIKAFNDNPESADQQVRVISQCYEDWKDELNFQHEYNANSKLADGAQRYTVARATDISGDGQCLVMDVARGVQMNKLMEMMKFYLENPAEYSTKYAKQISENPWLSNPERVIAQLPETLSKTFVEQFIFMKDGGQSLMHGDPHMGNYFIYENADGVLTPEFIDTGLCIERTADVIRSDIRFFSNYAVGNTKGIAEYFVDKCEISPIDRATAITVIAEDIGKEIFNQHTNITNFAQVQTAITSILDRHGLSLRADEATAMKAQMQFITGIADAYHLSGRHFDINPFLKDLPKAVYYMAKEGVNPWSEISSSFSFAFYNQVQTASTAAQFIYKKK